MKMKVYAVLDTKLGAFGGIFLDVKDEAAIRGFSDGVNDPNPQNKWFKHPEDFALYRLGEYHQDSGELIPAGKLVCLVTAAAVKTLAVNEAEVPRALGVVN